MMSDLTPMLWTCLLIVTVIGLFIFPMLPAMIEHRWPKDIAPLKVVREFDGNATNFARGFDRFVETELGEVLRSLGDSQSHSGLLKSGEPYLVLGKFAEFVLNRKDSERFIVDRMLVGAGNLNVPADILYQKEIYATADFSCGSLAACRAVFARGRIDLGSDSVILRWVHAVDRLAVRSGSQLFGRATSDTAIELDVGVKFERLHAPKVLFGPHAEETCRPDLSGISLTEWQPAKASMVGNHWRVSGSTEMPSHSTCAASLTVDGSLFVGDTCWLQSAVKGGVDLRLGENCRCDGAVVAGAFMEIGAGSRIKGPIISEGVVLLRRGCQVGSESTLTTITAPRVVVEPGVIVHGTIWAREQGEVRELE